MRILFLDQFSDLGGAQLCLLDLLPAVAARGWKSWLAAPGNGPLLERAPVSETVELHLASYRSGSKSLADVVRFAPDTLRAARHIRALIRRHRIDLVYVNGPRVLPAAVWGRAGKPLLYHAHSFLASKRDVRLVSWCLRTSRASVIANCHYVLALLGAGTVIYNGVAQALACEPQPRRRLVPTLGLLGRIAPEKGQLEFVHAVRKIVREFPQCRFLICGAPRPGDALAENYAREVRAAAAGLPVQFVPWTDNIGELLAQLDLLVVPSSPHEATTRVIPEAFSAAVPVVASRAGGIPEIVDDGVTGFLADRQTLASTILAALQKPPEELRAMGLRARQAWRDRFQLNLWQQRVLSVVEAAQQPPEQPSAE